MPKFSKLLVTDIYNTTREAVVINLRPENPLEFNFMQGQYLTFKKKIRGIKLGVPIPFAQVKVKAYCK